MEPFHKRIAELWNKFSARPGEITDQDVREWVESLKAHYNWAVKLSRLEALADLAHSLGDKDWEEKIGHQIDRHLINTTGGN